MSIRYLALCCALCCAMLLPVMAGAQGTAGDLPAPASAQEEQEVEAMIADAARPQESDPGIMIEDRINEYNTSGAGAQFMQKQDEGALFYTTASAPVMEKASSPAWPEFRQMAFKEAMLLAQQKYMEFLGVSMKSKMIRHMQSDPEFPKFSQEELYSTSRFEALLEKGLALLGGKLDAMLKEQGIDPQEFNALPPSKQKDLLVRSVTEETERTARGELSGMIPVQTFEARNDKGDHIVAVAVVASPAFKDFVREALAKKGELKPNPKRVGGPAVRDQVVMDKAEMINQFGIRRVYDENGYPVLVSFGQSYNPYTGQDYQARLENRGVALEQAAASAFANFAFLFKAHGTVSSASSNKAASSTIGKVEVDAKGNSFESTEYVRSVINQYTSTIEARGEVNDLPGVRRLHSWTYIHPEYGHEMVGVVYTWAPQDSALAKTLKEPAKQKQAPAAQKAKGQAGSSTGKQLMDSNDF